MSSFEASVEDPGNAAIYTPVTKAKAKTSIERQRKKLKVDIRALATKKTTNNRNSNGEYIVGHDQVTR